MRTRDIALIGGIGLGLTLAYSGAAQAGILPTFQPESIMVGSDRTGSSRNTSIGGGVTVKPWAGKSRLSRSDARALADYLNATQFGNAWSALPIRLLVALWSQESSLKPGAINPRDPRGGSFGIGQVQAGIASADYGVSDPASLLDPEIGALVSMKHLSWTRGYLSQRLGRAVSDSDVIQAYNTGAPGYVSGRRNLTYLTSVIARSTL